MADKPFSEEVAAGSADLPRGGTMGPFADDEEKISALQGLQ